MKRLLGWLKARKREAGAPVSVQRHIVVVRTTDLRLNDWCTDAGLVKEAQGLQATPAFQTMLAILRNESPANYSPPVGATHEDRIAHAAKAAGYHEALNNLEAMARYQAPYEHIESTFAPENANDVPR